MAKIIYTNPEGGVSVVHPTGTVAIEDLPAKLGLTETDYRIVEDDVIPSDRTLRNAWVIEDGKVVEDLVKSKEVAHGVRRDKRNEEFRPYDDVIAKQIPGADASNAEASRAAIRTKYAEVQTEIDASSTPDEVKVALSKCDS